MVAVVAHRGDSRRYRENTLAAVASAVEAGADRVEIDVVTTRDGVSVVNHDQTLLRLWGDPRRVADLTWDELADLGYGDVRIPRLIDVADALAGTGVGLIVDATNGPDAAAACRALAHWRERRREGRREGQEEEGHGDPAGHDGSPDVPPAGGAGALEVHWCGAPAATAAVRALDPAAILHLETGTGYADATLVADQRPRYLNMDGTLMSPATVAAAREAGLAVATWTIDDPDAMAVMVALGADSITTNRPGLLRRLLDDGSLAAMATRPTRPGSGQDHGTLVAAELDRCAAVAAELAGWAAQYLRESRPGTCATKAHAADLVTDVDRAVERHVRRVLAAEFPVHLVVGEEEGGRSAPGVPTWYLDPVDGTTNFAHGLGWCSFSLALAVDDTPLVGVVADPWRGEVLLAVAGAGATCDGVPLRAPRPPGAPDGSLAGAVVLTEWAAHEPFPGQQALLAELAGRHVTTRVMGSGTLSTAQIALGRAAGCVIGDFHPEDHLAATLIAREAGARLLDARGRDCLWPQGPFVVAAPAHAEELGALVCRCCGAVGSGDAAGRD